MSRGSESSDSEQELGTVFGLDSDTGKQTCPTLAVATGLRGMLHWIPMLLHCGFVCTPVEYYGQFKFAYY